MAAIYGVLLWCTVVTAYSFNRTSLPSYYNNIDPNARGNALRVQLTSLINSHKTLTYNALWGAFTTIDSPSARATVNCPTGRINDVYSSKCWTPSTEQCGNFKAEGDCYNREHSFPKSWWGGSTTVPAHSDLFHLFPSDGYDNGRRGNHPLGIVDPSTITYRTNSGCLLGKCASTAVPSGTLCWEPNDTWKGAMARAYFYISVVSARALCLHVCLMSCSNSVPRLTSRHTMMHSPAATLLQQMG